MTAEEVRHWIFTFGVDHPLARYYERIHGTFESARAEMVQRHGLRWAFQYRTELEAGTEKYGLRKLPEQETAHDPR